MKIHLSQSALKHLDLLKIILHTNELPIIERAIYELYARLIEEEPTHQNRLPLTLVEVLRKANLLKGLYNCNRNALEAYHPENKPLILEANTEEEAWQKMAILFPSETVSGFTIQEIDLLKL